MKAEKIKYIEDDIEYVLMKSGIYIGSIEPNQIETYIFKDEKLKKETIEHIPAFLKLFDEVISNSVDEAIKTDFRFANKIEIKADKTGITIIDNGRGISSLPEENTGLPQAVVALTKLKAGSNFKEERSGLGQNGVGAALVNIFSKKFNVDTSDGIKKTIITCKNNLSTMKFSQKKCSKQYTKISYLPDYERLNMIGLDEIHLSLIRKRLLSINLCYPQISLVFNGSKLGKSTLKNYINMFDSSSVSFISQNEFIDIAIMPFQEKSEYLTFVNGNETLKHGQHLEVFNRLFKKAIKNHKSKSINQISLNNFLTNCRVIIILKNMKNASFPAQIKNELTNSYSDVKTYFKDVDFESFLMTILRNKEFKDCMKEYAEALLKIAERKELGKDEKKLKKRNVSKFLAPISNRKKFCNFYLCEGDSAIAQLINVRNNFVAGYPLRGKVINPRKATLKDVMNNDIMKDLLHLLGLKLSSPSIEKFKYKAIYILTDSDVDGDAIAMQLLNIFYTFWPDLIHQGKIFRVLSPLIIAKHKKTKELKIFYSIVEFNKNNELYDILEYNKGLGSLDLKEYRKLVDSPELIEFTATDNTEAMLDMLFGKSNEDKRKQWLLKGE